MRTKTILSVLTMVAVMMAFSHNEAGAAVSVQVATPGLSFSLSDYQAPPPNVYILNDRGRPYYMHRDRRVYMEKRKHGKHYKKEKRHHDNGRDHGHGR